MARCDSVMWAPADGSCIDGWLCMCVCLYVCNDAGVDRVHVLEEQLRETELRAASLLAEEQRRSRDIIVRVCLYTSDFNQLTALLACLCFNYLYQWFQAPCVLGSIFRISPPRFLAEYRKRWLNLSSFVLLCFVLLAFYPRDAMLARVIVIATCPSVRLSVCHAPVLCQNEES